MSQNKVEIALKLLKDEFIKDSKSATGAWSRDMQQMQSDAGAMSETWTKGLNKTKVASEQLADAQREAATERQRLSDARGDLGLDAVIDQNREVSKLKDSYEELNRSGRANNLAQDQQNLRQEVNKVRAGVEGSAKATDAWSRGMQRLQANAKTATDSWTAGLYKVSKASEILAAAQRKAANERKRLASARDNLGITSIQAQNREIAKLTASYNRLAKSGKLSAVEVTQAQEALRRKVAEVRGEVVKEGSALKKVGRSLAPYIGAAAAGAFAVNFGKAAVTAADDYKRLNSQIRLVTDSEEELADTNEKLFDLAQETRTEFEPVVGLYTRIARSTKDLNLSQKDMLGITKAVSQSMKISGASTQEAASGVLQFSQALQSGVLAGDEFKSLSENSPRLMQALADGMDVPRAALRQMAEDGELTASRVIAALTGQSQAIDEEFQKLDKTAAGTFVTLKNQFAKALSETDLDPFIHSMEELTETLENPAIVEGLVNLAGALVTVAEKGIKAAAGIGDFFSILGSGFDLEFGDLSALEEVEAKLNINKTSQDKWYDAADRQSPLYQKHIESLEEYRDMLVVVDEYDKKVASDRKKLLEEYREAARPKTADEILAAEQKIADNIVGINKRIATAKQNIAAQQVERSKIIMAEELKIAKQNGGEIIKQIRQEQGQRQQAINDRLTAAKQAAKDIISIEKGIVDEKLALQNKLKGIDQSVEGKLFERSLSGKSEFAQQILIEQQATEKLIEAKKALKEGRLDDATALSQEAQGFSDRVSNIDRANALLVEGARLEKETLKAVTAERVKADEEKIAKLQEYKKLQEQAAGIEQSGLDADIKNVDELAEKLQSLGQESPTIKIDSNIAELTQQVENLVRQLNSVASAGFNAGGQISGFRTGGKLPGYNTGGSVQRQLIMAEDGEWYLPKNIVDYYGAASIASVNQMKLSGFAEGGKLPGYGGGDRRMMNPQVGGFIIRKEAARKYGDGFMSDLLSKKIPKFNTGGGIRINPALLSISNLPKLQTGGAVAANSSAGSASVQRHEVVIGEQQFNIFGEQDQVTGLLGALTEVARGG